ncbi:DUF222 domain-containing protein [Microbispora oryzae]|uniref:DUF222 domain-containing protein n=1 Tax=Microbispora oryzae TaxID=2806554 RepID=UPI0027DD03A4|nr:DUF222 domain-containing protein [Microbispora oryzae]
MELLRVAARWAAAEVPDSSAVCLQRAETLIQAVDLLYSAMVALLHRVDVTGEAKAYGHASTASWLRSDRPSTPDPTTPAPSTSAPSTSAPAASTSDAAEIGAEMPVAPGVAETGAEAPGTPGVHGPPMVARRGPGMTGAQAARWLRISGEVARLPEVKARYRAGSLSGGAVDAITTVTTKLTDTQATEAEPILLQLSDNASCAEVAKAGRYIREILDPGTLVQECEDDYASRFLLVRPSSTGGVEGEFRLPREAAARLRAFLTSYARPKDKDDDRPLRVRQADAFSALLSEKVSTELVVMVRAESLPDDILAPTGAPKAPPAGAQDATPTVTDSDTTVGATDPTTQNTSPGASRATGARSTAGAAGARGDDEAPSTARAGRDGPNDEAAPPEDGPPGDGRPEDGSPEDAPEEAGRGDARPDHAAEPDHSAGSDDAAWPDDRLRSGNRGDGMPAATATATDADAHPHAGAGADGRAQGRPQSSGGTRADACRTCGHAPNRLAPGLLVSTGHLLPVSDVHRLARTSRLTRMVMDAKGQVLDMGRSVRLATPAQRKALLAQYATCYCQGCPIPATMTEVDHVHGWIDDGVTNLDLLAPACTFHNRDKFTHPHRYTTHRNPNGTWTLTHHPNRRRYERSTRQRPG